MFKEQLIMRTFILQNEKRNFMRVFFPPDYDVVKVVAEKLIWLIAKYILGHTISLKCFALNLEMGQANF